MTGSRLEVFGWVSTGKKGYHGKYMEVTCASGNEKRTDRKEDKGGVRSRAGNFLFSFLESFYVTEFRCMYLCSWLSSRKGEPYWSCTAHVAGKTKVSLLVWKIISPPLLGPYSGISGPKRKQLVQTKSAHFSSPAFPALWYGHSHPCLQSPRGAAANLSDLQDLG